MKLTTTFWTKENHDFCELLFINKKTNEIIFSTDLNNKTQSSVFFKSIAKLFKSRKFLGEMRSLWSGKSDVFYQFAVRKNNEILNIVWFDLVINERIAVSHDVAFSTVMIEKNKVNIPFGKFPMVYKNRKLPIYREFKVKAKAYKFISNLIASS
jgi:hypothetical protein